MRARVVCVCVCVCVVCVRCVCVCVPGAIGHDIVCLPEVDL